MIKENAPQGSTALGELSRLGRVEAIFSEGHVLVNALTVQAGCSSNMDSNPTYQACSIVSGFPVIRRQEKESHFLFIIPLWLLLFSSEV